MNGAIRSTASVVHAVAAIAVACAMMLAGPLAHAQQGGPDAPKAIKTRWMTYEPGSMGHLQAMALAQAIKARTKSEIVVLTNASDTDRHKLLFQGKVDYLVSGLGSFFAQEGVFAYARPDLGPQEVRLVLGAWSNNIAIATTGGSGIARISDLRGRRVGVLGGSTASFHALQSLLDVAGLALRDVKRIDLTGPALVSQALLMDKADAVLELTGSTSAHMIAGGPKGIHWLPVPHADEASWKRLVAKAPYLVRRTDTTGAGVQAGKAVEGAAYPYPILVTRPPTRDGDVQQLATVVLEAAQSLKGSVPGIDGWDVRFQRTDWVVPFHPGAILRAQAQGSWTAEAQAHNDRLLARQRVLSQAWAEIRGQLRPDMPPADVTRIWMQLRARRLTEAGYEPYF